MLHRLVWKIPPQLFPLVSSVQKKQEHMTGFLSSDPAVLKVFEKVPFIQKHGQNSKQTGSHLSKCCV